MIQRFSLVRGMESGASYLQIYSHQYSSDSRYFLVGQFIGFYPTSEIVTDDKDISVAR